MERGGHRFPLREMSDGYRTVAALVVDLLKQIHEAYGSLEVAEADGSSLPRPASDLSGSRGSQLVPLGLSSWLFRAPSAAVVTSSSAPAGREGCSSAPGLP
ncbi:hypothetical protein L3i22_034870 [Actinoplanes sp. L3-i22]|nr:hypothetical protein L3i22_034870 [Actinoplanes sp. L3-i22]